MILMGLTHNFHGKKKGGGADFWRSDDFFGGDQVPSKAFLNGP